MKAEFEGTEETDPAPKPTLGEKVCAMTEKIVCEFGKMTKRQSARNPRRIRKEGIVRSKMTVRSQMINSLPIQEAFHIF